MTSFSRSKFHICVNNDTINGIGNDATINDSRLSVDGSGLVNIGGSLMVNNTNILTSINSKQNIIADDDLTIAKTNGLQSALNDKLDTTVFNTQIALKADLTDIYNKKCYIQKQKWMIYSILYLYRVMLTRLILVYWIQLFHLDY